MQVTEGSITVNNVLSETRCFVSSLKVVSMASIEPGYREVNAELVNYLLWVKI
jgi:hypothetical protein